MKALSIVFALAAALLGVGTGTARAAVVLLDVSGSMDGMGNTFCEQFEHRPCQLGGYIVIGNATNVVIAAGVTLTVEGSPPLTFTFDRFFRISAKNGLTDIDLETTPAGTELQLIFATATAGSVVGYTGGLLSTQTMVVFTSTEPLTFLTLISGSLTETNAATPVPEPSSLLLLVTAIAVVSAGLFARRLLHGAAPPRFAA